MLSVDTLVSVVSNEDVIKERAHINMKKIILVTETGADVPPDLAQRYGIHIVPMYVSFGDTSREDGTFPVEEICTYYQRTGELPKTSASTPGDFERAFDEIHSQWPTGEILYLAYSAVTTCTYQNAQIAAEGRNYVTSVDTKFASAGECIIVLRMAQLLEEHPEWTMKDAVAAAEDLVLRGRMCFLPNDMEYLRAGGRVSNAVALCGKLLGIHPLIEFQDGYLRATKKLRGKLLKLAPRLVADYAADNKLEKDVLCLIYSPDLADEIKETSEQAAHACGFQQIMWIKTGGVITTHSGPGAFGMVGFSEI